ncbi:MAG: hypothetical protein WKF62_00810, partial [Solirubrobacterales bacterium]
ARLLVDAQGLDPAGVEKELPNVLFKEAIEPGRVLVLTDRVDVLPVLRKAKVGAEHLVAPSRRDLILADRPLIRRVIKLSETGSADTLDG